MKGTKGAILDKEMEKGQKDIKVVMFDLNGTFYNKSSKEEFFKFICKKRPSRLRYAFRMTYYYLLLKLHRIRQTEFKENFFNYLDNFPPAEVENYAREFWQQEFPKKFNEELLKLFDSFRKEGVVVFCATGGFEIYVKPLFEMYNVHGFAGTKVHYTGKTYEIVGKACKEEEKIRRLEQFLKGKPYRIIAAFSDSKEEMLERAERAFLIKEAVIHPYD